MKKKQPGIYDDHQRKLLNNLNPNDHDAVITWIENIHGVAERREVSKAFMKKAAKKLNSFLPEGYVASGFYPKNGSKDDKYKWLVRVTVQNMGWWFSERTINEQAATKRFFKAVNNYRQS